MTFGEDARRYVWHAVLLLTFICDVLSFVHLLSRGKQFVVDVASDVTLECEFYTDDFNLFDNPILWRKIQLNEQTQMNMMGNLMEPFSSTKRFKVSFVPQPPRYVLTLFISDTRHEDSGNYTCEVNGPHNTLLGAVTHYIYVRAPVVSVVILNDNKTDFDSKTTQFLADHLIYTENEPGTLRCVAVGGYPPADIAIYIGRRDVTAQLTHAHSAKLTGSPGLRRIEYTAERWTHKMTASADDDGKEARCVAVVAGLPANTTLARIVVHYAPVITCSSSSAFVGDRNAFLHCSVKARPWVTALYWILDLNGTTIGTADSVSDYWTKNVDRSEGTLETTLYMRKAKPENFRIYTLIAENRVGVRSQHIRLIRKHRTTPDARATLRSSQWRRGHTSGDQRSTREMSSNCGCCSYVSDATIRTLLLVIIALNVRQRYFV